MLAAGITVTNGGRTRTMAGVGVAV
jgi:hypothetical protein